MDLVRLAIIYDTSQAAGKVQELERNLNHLQGASRGATDGVGQVRRGLEMLAERATGVQGPIGRVASGLLRMGTGGDVALGAVAGIGLIAGAYKLASDAAEALTKANNDAAESLRKVMEAGAPNAKALDDWRAAAADLAKAQKDLQILQESRDPTKMAFWFRGQGLAKLLPKFPASDAEIITQQGTVDQLTLRVNRLRDAWLGTKTAIEEANQPEWLKKQHTAILEAQRDFITQRMNMQAVQGRPAGEAQFPLGTQFFADVYTHDLGELQTNVEGIVKALEIAGIKFEDMGNASVGLKGKFDIAGKAVLDFVGFLAQALGVLFPGNPALSTALLGIGNAITAGHATGGGGGGSNTPLSGRGGGSPRPEVVSNVNFNIMAMDAQGVAQFVERNGPQIAAEVTRQADRSRAIRRRFWR
jgi:hypothetical protein